LPATGLPGIEHEPEQVVLCTESTGSADDTAVRIGNSGAPSPACRWQAFDPSAGTLSATSRPEAAMIQKPPRYFSFPTWIGLGHTAGTRSIV
jgi:hypothetical protein